MDKDLELQLNATLEADSGESEVDVMEPESETPTEDTVVKTPTENAEEATEVKEAPETKESEVEEPVFEIHSEWLKDKNKFTESEIVDAIRGQMRGSDYKKKTAELAEQRRGFESVRQFADALKQADIEESLIETLQDAGIEDAEKIVKAAFAMEPIEHPDSGKVSELSSELEATRANLALIESKEELQEELNLKRETVNAVYDYAVKRFADTGQFLSLKDAYKLGDFDKRATVKKVQPAIPTPPKVTPGAKPEDTKQWPGQNDPLDAVKHRLFTDD